MVQARNSPSDGLYLFHSSRLHPPGRRRLPLKHIPRLRGPILVIFLRTMQSRLGWGIVRRRKLTTTTLAKSFLQTHRIRHDLPSQVRVTLGSRLRIQLPFHHKIPHRLDLFYPLHQSILWSRNQIPTKGRLLHRLPAPLGHRVQRLPLLPPLTTSLII